MLHKEKLKRGTKLPKSTVPLLYRYIGIASFVCREFTNYRVYLLAKSSEFESAGFCIWQCCCITGLFI